MSNEHTLCLAARSIPVACGTCKRPRVGCTRRKATNCPSECSAKAKPESLTYASPGVGTFIHLSNVLLHSLTGTRLRHVPYGAQPWQPDLLGGHVDAAMFPLITMVDHVKSGKLRALAISNGKQRSSQLPEVPQFSEVGLAQYDPIVWAGLVAPGGTPKPILDKLNAALVAAVKDPQFKESLAKLGAEAVTPDRATPESLAKHLKAEIDKWGPIIKQAGVYAD